MRANGSRDKRANGRRALALLFTAGAGALTFSAAAASAPQEDVPVPKLVGLSRSAAEAKLTESGLRYLPPTPRAARYEFISVSDGVERAVPEALAPDRTVFAQEPPGGSVAPGDVVNFGTVAPAGANHGDRYVSTVYGGSRTRIAANGRGLTVSYRGLERRCDPLDHVDIGLAARYVAVEPMLTASTESESRCQNGSRRAVRLELPEPVGDRIVLDTLPGRAQRGLHSVEATRYISARGRPDARAVVIRFARSSDCGLRARTRVRETSRTVKITLFAGNVSRSRFCLLDLIHDVAVVPLRKPLGNRHIIDGAPRG